MSKISATIITFNEEAGIAACIESLRDIVDEIIIVDSFSTDSTVEICKALGHHVTQRKMRGFGAQRQYATSLTSHNYVLSIDADEVLSPALRASLIKLKKEKFQHRGYCFSRLNFYCGTPIKHCGWYPDLQVRLFDKRYANWNLHNVKERVIFTEDVVPERVDGDILHYRCSTPQEYQATETNHALMHAKALCALPHRPSAVESYLHALKGFLDCYIAKGGFCDGIAGREIALQRYHSTLLAYSSARKAALKNEH